MNNSLWTIVGVSSGVVLALLLTAALMAPGAILSWLLVLTAATHAALIYSLVRSARPSTAEAVPAAPVAEQEAQEASEQPHVADELQAIRNLLAVQFGPCRYPPSEVTTEWLRETMTVVRNVAGVPTRVLYQRQRRTLSRPSAQEITDYWSEHLNIALTVEYVGYLADRIESIESSCIGRLAGAVEDAVLRQVIMTALEGDHIRVLEIGTLFGVNAVGMLDAGTAQGRQTNVTSIDPLDGYYGPGEKDWLTSLPVTRASVETNLRRHGFGPEQFRLIQHLSTDAKVPAALQEAQFDLLVIDGDHTYDGVAKDFDGFLKFVRPGGFILFDDYGSDGWPDVQRCVDEHVSRSAAVEWVGSQWCTAVFRKKPA